jgi:hypothetical protein
LAEIRAAVRFIQRDEEVKKFLKNNGLSLVVSAFFILTLIGQALAGWKHEQEEKRRTGEIPSSFSAYLGSPEFGEAVFENWESEFLQMGLYVILTAFLFQKGSSESKDPQKSEAVDREPNAQRKNAPWPVKYGGLPLKIYRHSLSLAFLALFLFCFVGHWISGAKAYNDEIRRYGEAPIPIFQYGATAQFWFESLQNWQSEFLAVLSIVVLSIWLREKGSPESKPVDAPHDETGGA